MIKKIKEAINKKIISNVWLNILLLLLKEILYIRNFNKIKNLPDFDLIILNFFSKYEFHKQRPQHLADSLSKKQNKIIIYYDSSLNIWKFYFRKINDKLYLTNSILSFYKLTKNRNITIFSNIFHHYKFFKYIGLNFKYHYDYLDNLEPFSINLFQYLKKNINKFADSITCSSILLKQQLEKIWYSNVYYLPNGVNWNNWTSNFQEQNKKIIWFYWWIWEHLDFELIKLILEKIDNNTELWFIGWDSLWLIERYKLKDNKKFKYFWQKQYDELKKYSSKFNIAIIPFKINEVTDYVSPVKYFEYISQGIPTVSTGFYEMTQHNDYCLISTNTNDFVKKIIENINLRKQIKYVNKIKKYSQDFERDNLILNLIKSWKSVLFYEQDQKL